MFAYTLADNCLERPDGLIIGSIFTLLLMLACGRQPLHTLGGAPHPARISSPTSRAGASGPSCGARRCTWFPCRSLSAEARRRKRAEIARHYNVRGPFLFLHVNLLDNRSEFSAPARGAASGRRARTTSRRCYGAVAIANTIAFVSEAIDPISIFIGLTRRDLMAQAVRYLLFGEGETGLMVYTILLRYWDWTPEEDVRPLIFLMSGRRASPRIEDGHTHNVRDGVAQVRCAIRSRSTSKRLAIGGASVCISISPAFCSRAS